MIRANRIIVAAFAAFAFIAPGGSATAQQTVKIGVVAEFSGPFADYGSQILAGMKTYLKLNGDVFGGKKVELIVKDTTGAAPDIAKRLAQELVTQDNVDILAGFGLTPNALAVAPVSAEAKKPMVIKDAKPEAVFVFLPPGSQTIALKQAGIRIIATGDLTDDGTLQAMGEPAIGLTTSFHYSAAHDSPENKVFIKAYVETNGTRLRPNFMACAGYDGMAAIAEALKKTGGSVDPDKFLAALKGMRIMSPRGAIMIDPETRDVVQTVYIRRVEKVDGLLYNIEFDKYPDVKDPGKQN